MNIGESWQFKFAGQIIDGIYIGTDDLSDGVKVYIFENDNTKYPIRKENICGNSKQ